MKFIKLKNVQIYVMLLKCILHKNFSFSSVICDELEKQQLIFFKSSSALQSIPGVKKVENCWKD